MMAKIKYWLCWLWDLPLAFLITVFELIDHECRHNKKCLYKKDKTFTENLDDTMSILQDVRNQQYLEQIKKREERINTNHNTLWK